MGRRRKARELLVQALYASRVGGQDLGDAVRQQVARRHPSAESLEYVQSLCADLAERATEFDALIDGVLTGRSPERVGVVERCVLHLALAELRSTAGVPHTVILHEALELARTFGTDESARFVNGVLDRIRQQLQEGTSATS